MSTVLHTAHLSALYSKTSLINNTNMEARTLCLKTARTTSVTPIEKLSGIHFAQPFGRTIELSHFGWRTVRLSKVGQWQ